MGKKRRIEKRIRKRTKIGTRTGIRAKIRKKKVQRTKARTRRASPGRMRNRLKRERSRSITLTFEHILLRCERNELPTAWALPDIERGWLAFSRRVDSLERRYIASKK